jgi:hypothetical protein
MLASELLRSLPSLRAVAARPAGIHGAPPSWLQQAPGCSQLGKHTYQKYCGFGGAEWRLHQGGARAPGCSQLLVAARFIRRDDFIGARVAGCSQLGHLQRTSGDAWQAYLPYRGLSQVCLAANKRGRVAVPLLQSGRGCVAPGCESLPSWLRTSGDARRLEAASPARSPQWSAVPRRSAASNP